MAIAAMNVVRIALAPVWGCLGRTMSEASSRRCYLRYMARDAVLAAEHDATSSEVASFRDVRGQLTFD
jgi:hypothetical protein